jgi:fibronectin type 3 domain-containing protein
MKTRALALVALLLISSALTPAMVLAGTDGPLPWMRPMANPPEWTDSLDDLSHVYVPTGGLVGVEVVGGEARLKTGSDSGWIASSIISCPADWRYDLVLLDAVVPGKSVMNVTILDATKAPTKPMFANETIPGLVNVSGTDVSLTKLDRASYPSIRIQVNLLASGTDRPRLLGWQLLFGSTGEWRDNFLGTGKAISWSGLNISGGAARLGTPVAGYDPYPTIVLNSDSSDLAVFYANTAGDGYQDMDTIDKTTIAGGIDIDDLDEDGYLDLIVAMDISTATDSSCIMWGSSSGTWSKADMQQLTIQDMGSDATTGDVDGDGDRDVIICCPQGMIATATYVWLNQGNGVFNANPSLTLRQISGTSVDAGDINEDGYDDIIVVNSLRTIAQCLFGGATGPDANVDLTFLAEITTHAFVGDVLIEDVTGDGHNDVLFATMNDNDKIPIYLGSDSGVDLTADIELPVSLPPMDVATGDVNGDGHLDLAYSCTDNTGGVNDAVFIFEGTATGWDDTTPHKVSTGTGLTPVEVVDVNVDGYEDVITGDASELNVFLGGTAWPTAASITKTGLSYPDDIVVAVSKGGATKPRGELVSEPIPLPDGMRWDILYVDVDVQPDTEVLVSVLGSNKQPISGLDKLSRTDVDLSPLKALEPIHVKLEMRSASPDATPVVEYLLVNWVDRFAWREQFYGDAKVQSFLGDSIGDNALAGPTYSSARPDLLFACLRSDTAYDSESLGFLDIMDVDPLLPPMHLKTMGASAVDAFDADRDGIPDLAFASYGPAEGVYAGSSPLFRGSAAGYYRTPWHKFDTMGAMDVAIRDINGDGHADVIFAQERDATTYRIDSLLFWGDDDGWNDTADLRFATSGASDVEVADVEGDGRLDLVFACYSDDEGVETDSMVFLQGTTGFCGTVPSILLPTVGARAVDTGDLNADGHLDLVFANSYDGASFEIRSYIYWGRPTGGINPIATQLGTLGAMDVKVANLNADTWPDLVFANSRNASSGHRTESFIYLNRGPGNFGPSFDVAIPTEGAVAVAVADLDGAGRKDLVFGCRYNDTTFGIPSVVHLGGASGWSMTPDLELPTVGAVDVLPLQLTDPERAGYLSRPITPEESDDISAFHTLSYTANLVSGATGTIRIVDASTGEYLYQEYLADGTHTLDVSEAFSYALHPSVRVLVSLEGLAYGSSTFQLSDLFLNWTKRVHMAPVIHDTGLTNTMCYRASSVELWVNVTDEYDATGLLTVVVEHQLAGETAWRSYLLSSPVLRDGIWTVKVAPDRAAPTGSYKFRVSVSDSDQLSTGFVELASTLAVLPNLPGAPRLQEPTVSDGQVSLEWMPPLVQGDLPVEGYRVLRGPTPGELAVVATVTVPATSYTDDGLTNGVTYHYAVQAFNLIGNSTLSEVLAATPRTVPGAPRGFDAQVVDGVVTMSWEAPAYDGGFPLLGYRVYRAFGEGASEMLAEVMGTTYVDSTVTVGLLYRYNVRAFTVVGEGLASEDITVMPLGMPGEPRELAVVAGAATLTLSWTVPSDTGGTPVVTYVVYRGGSASTLARLHEVAGDTLTFVDDEVVAGTTYFYAVAAVTDAGEGAMAAAVSAKAIDVPGAPEGPTAVGGDLNVSLTWTAPASDGYSPITGYVVLRGASATDLQEVAQLGVVTRYVDTGLTNGATYHYAVLAVNAAGRGANSVTVSAMPAKPVVVPGKVGALVAQWKDGKVVLQWTAPTSDGGSLLTGYVVMRGTSAGNMTLLSEIGVLLTFSDTTAKRGSTYYYTVVARNAVGQGEPFAAVEVKVPKKPSDGPGFDAAVALAAVAAVAMVALNSQRRRPRGA